MTTMNKKTSFIFIFLIFFIAGGIYLDQSTYFSSVENKLQKISIPSPLILFCEKAEIIKRMGLTYVLPDDYSAFFNSETGDFQLRDVIDMVDASNLDHLKNRSIPDQIPQEKFPSSLVMDKKMISTISTGIPVLSIVVEKKDLYDPLSGIFTNAGEKGKKWERLSFISLYEGGKLLLATSAGIRVHGGDDRSDPVKGLRFYFRDLYGCNQQKRQELTKILFGEKKEPLKRIVVRLEPGYFNAIGLDISRQIGCITPDTKPVKVYLNGSSYGKVFLLTEHISKDYFTAHYGHDNYICARALGSRIRKPGEYYALRSWARNKDIKMTMKEVEKKVDIENLTRWWISQIYCASNDTIQGPILIDKNRRDAKWFLINWDMDHSIRNVFEPDRKMWEQELVLFRVMDKESNLRGRNKKRPRAVLFRRLCREDPEYLKYFEQLLMNTLNHKLTGSFFESRVSYYENIASDLGFKAFHGKNIRHFFKHRHSFVMKLMRKYFDSPEIYFCRIKGPEDMNYKIDGFIAESEYEGQYFRGSQITVEVVNNNGKNVSFWLINGNKIKSFGNKLTYNVNSETTIEPVFSPQQYQSQS